VTTNAGPITEVLVEHIRALVECESPSADLDAVARSAAVVAGIGEQVLGSAPEFVVIDGVTHLRWRFGAGDRVVVLAHHDTVWPIGTLERKPFTVSDGVMTGPGCFDMKAGIVMAIHAIAELENRDGVTLLVTGDEEPGSPSSRSLIEDTARGARAALVLEASADGGALKIARKGVSFYRAEITGLAAHAGLEPEKGINATVELARLVLAATALADPDAGTTVTPTVVVSGTTSNTVPARASVDIDARARTVAEQERVDVALRGLAPAHPGASIVLHGGINRPPLEPGASRALFDRAQAIAARLGLEPLVGVAVGGGSDGNVTAGIGVPTLDGLGAVGGGAHADDEHVVIAELPRRMRLVSRLIAELAGEDS
jgi:glutamate carboxypeptidase